VEQDATATAEALKNPDPTIKLVVPSAPIEEADRELVIFGLRLPPYHIIIPQTWKHLLAVWCVFFATLAIYPTVQIGITPAQFTNQDSFLVKYWMSIVVFLLFNVTAMLGNFLAWFDWFVKLPCCRSNFYWIMAVIRVFVSVFFFLFLCNYLPETRTLRIFFSHDILFLIGAIFFGLTSGAFSSLAMMYAPRAVKDPRDAPTAGMLAALCLTFGLFCGAMFSFVLKNIVHIG
jgi:equilibrative nucleoside transporter 1/2/3